MTCSLPRLKPLPPPAPPFVCSRPAALLIISLQRAPSHRGPAPHPRPPCEGGCDVPLEKERTNQNPGPLSAGSILEGGGGGGAQLKPVPPQGDTSSPIQFTSNGQWTWGHKGLALSPQIGTAQNSPASQQRFPVNPNHSLLLTLPHPACSPPHPLTGAVTTLRGQ